VGAIVALSTVLLSNDALAQAQARKETAKSSSSDSVVVVVASKHYEAGSFHRWLLGDNWRDIWATPIKVPVLNLSTFAGGLKPVDTGGSAQTTSLRFIGADGNKYAFRPVYKDRLVHLEPYHNTIVADIFRDGLSSLHPAGPLAAPPFLEAAGIIHPVPHLFVMPDDPALGEFRKEFAGKLGAIEDRALMPEEGPGLGGAVELIDSDDLLKRLNKSPKERIDARTYLAARLIDILLNDYDRHLNQWRWARVQPRFAGSTTGDDIVWVPIPRDRDAAFINHQGVLMRLARKVKPNLVSFDATYPSMRAFIGAVIDLDQRLLVELDKTVWDSVTAVLKTKITDAVIDAAVQRMPHEYMSLHQSLIANLRSRRDNLHKAADEYYRILAQVVEIHAPDSEDQATVLRDGSDVVVRLQTGSAQPWFNRRFKPNETREVRVYMHGGNDSVLVDGQGEGRIFIRIVGGNGTNTFTDSSLVGHQTPKTRFYDEGTVDDVTYGKDTVFNRRPWVEAYGTPVPPQKDRGSSVGYSFGVGAGSGLGWLTKVGYTRKTYGFRYLPYKDRMTFEFEYAAGENRLFFGVEGDRRVENSRLHYIGQAAFSQLEIVEFRGFGNTIPTSDDPFFDVHQHQWVVRPAIAMTLSEKGSISLGPILKYVQTDSTPGTFISEEAPFGFPRFGEIGAQLRAENDTRDSLSTSGHRFVASASYYPQVWDVETGFGEVSALASTYISFPILTRPTLALRAGAKKVFGDAPYFESAFLGGRRSLRALHRQRYAGDAVLHGTTELRVPLLRFNYLLPWSIGAIGFFEAGRVWDEGESPGTWHSAKGFGGWIGLLSSKYSIQLLSTDRPERRFIIGTGLAF
jgi:hypothetical protein